MANNRMFLVHVPSGVAVCIATRMGYGWHVNDRNRLAAKVQYWLDVILDELEDAAEQDDVALILEHSDRQSIEPGDWNYSKEAALPGLVRLEKRGD